MTRVAATTASRVFTRSHAYKIETTATPRAIAEFVPHEAAPNPAIEDRPLTSAGLPRCKIATEKDTPRASALAGHMRSHAQNIRMGLPPGPSSRIRTSWQSFHRPLSLLEELHAQYGDTFS